MTTRTVTMSHSELDRFGVIIRVRERRLTQVEAARILELGVRQVQRLCAAVATQGADGLISRKRARPSGRRFSDEFRRTILTLITAHYSGLGAMLKMVSNFRDEKRSLKGPTRRYPAPARLM
jgi:hypothetical protein